MSSPSLVRRRARYGGFPKLSRREVRVGSRAGRDERLREAREQCLRFLGELGPGHADDAEARGGEHGIPPAVGLERGARGVEREAVDLDDEPLRTPEEIDFVSADDDVHLRLAESGL